MIETFIIIAELFILITVAYTVYKVIWYFHQMRALRKLFREMDSDRVSVTPKRSFSDIVFGVKGAPDFVIAAPGRSVEVSVLSFISIRSRWNIEKAPFRYYFEVRKYSNIIYKTERNTGTEPEHARDYRRESRIIRSELALSPTNKAYDKQILLIYPRPKQLTYTETGLDILDSGSRVGSHEIMYIDAFTEYVRKELSA